MEGGDEGSTGGLGCWEAGGRVAKVLILALLTFTLVFTSELLIFVVVLLALGLVGLSDCLGVDGAAGMDPLAVKEFGAVFAVDCCTY